ncbi:MAG TPA: right-handed parallel beta-helix repeat-containing protein, partial [Kiritimatiellia bacterium]|nr:right-handed parallel beta-helix repeat-containing protein [Kiritimatiellia bacterium]
AASGTVLDAGGGWLNEGKRTEILICSRWNGSAWERPADITIRNAKLRGAIRITGMGRNGQGAAVRASSRTEGHTARAQAAAPTRVTISNVWIEADGRIPIYLAPGVTHVTVEACVITGRSRSVAFYFDAESGRNTLRGNTFAARVAREAVAVDGSAGNRIVGNVFTSMPLGGIYLYRNCGEGGTVRHQTPNGNILADNRFMTRGLARCAYGIWLGSRNGRRAYCGCDAGYPFGSSLDNRDFADDNIVTNNMFTPMTPRALRDDGSHNRIVL